MSAARSRRDAGNRHRFLTFAGTRVIQQLPASNSVTKTQRYRNDPTLTSQLTATHRSTDRAHCDDE
jgi:hypothetical protein